MTHASRPGGFALFGLVEEYFALGHHRTGSAPASETVAWMVQHLCDRGLKVETRAVPYMAWHGSSELRIDGEEVEHLAVPYEWEGEIDSMSPVVGSFHPGHGGFSSLLDDAIEEHRRGTTPLVLTTSHPTGELVGVNRHSLGFASRVPTILCAGREVDRLSSGDVRVTLSADRRAGEVLNIVARNDVPGVPLLVTTPLNGWFGCAGERGTGIAVLLDFIERFQSHPLLVVVTAGHELGWFGAVEFVATNNTPIAAVVHLGASAAVEEDTPSGRVLASTRLAVTSIDGDVFESMSAALAPANLDLGGEGSTWLGEASAFADLDVPMLSVTGAGADFHTPMDTPERSTSPAALAVSADAIGDAAKHLLMTVSHATD